MNMEPLLQKVREAISRELEIDPQSLADDASLRTEYGLDSVAAVSIIFFLEKELGVEIDLKAFVGVDSINDLKLLLIRDFGKKGEH
jgi:acyl carrier protein